MTVRQHHDALVERLGDVDPTLTTVLRRGGHLRRRRRRLACASVVAAVVSVVGIGVASYGTGSSTRVTTAGETKDAATTTSTAIEPARAASTIRLRAPDWETASRDGTRSKAAGARYLVVSPDGDVLERGAIGTSGEAVITVRASSVTISVDTCAFEGPVDHLAPGRTAIVGFPCGGGGKTLPPQSIPVTVGNPTDDELRAANQEAVRCIEAEGLQVSNVELDIDPAGQVSRGIQIGLASSGLTFDEVGEVQARCEERYLSLVFARGDWLDEQD